MLYILYRPGRVFTLCIIFGFASLLFSGNLMRLFQLSRDRVLIFEQMSNLKAQITDFDQQLTFAKDPAFIERRALDLYDLVDEHDLVFVFADE